MTTNSVAALELKRLREHAGYSVRQLAAALREVGSEFGRSPSSYAYYENGFKKLYLPQELVHALAPLLVGRGSPPIGEQQLFALAGPPYSLWKFKPIFTEKPNANGSPQIEADLLAEILQGIGSECEGLSLELTDLQRSRLAAEIYNQIIATDGMYQPGKVAYEIAHACRIAKVVL